VGKETMKIALKQTLKGQKKCTRTIDLWLYVLKDASIPSNCYSFFKKRPGIKEDTSKINVCTATERKD